MTYHEVHPVAEKGQKKTWCKVKNKADFFPNYKNWDFEKVFFDKVLKQVVIYNMYLSKHIFEETRALLVAPSKSEPN